MKLCFDATRFGSGLDGAVELAAQRGIEFVEYSFAAFAPGKNAKGDDKERKYLETLKSQADDAGVHFAMLNLDYALRPLDKKSVKQCAAMLAKLTPVAQTLGCPRLSFCLAPPHGESAQDWVETVASFYSELPRAKQVDYVLRLSTPPEFRGVTLKNWRQTEPEEWRRLLSLCDGLSLSYSPGDLLWLGVDYLQNMSSFNQAISHVVAHDVEMNRAILQDSGMFGPLFWRYRQAGKGQVDWRQVVELLRLYDFAGVLSIQLDDEFIADDTLSLEDALGESQKYFAPMLKG